MAIIKGKGYFLLIKFVTLTKKMIMEEKIKRYTLPAHKFSDLS